MENKKQKNIEREEKAALDYIGNEVMKGGNE